jgi:hypothetical protein
MKILIWAHKLLSYALYVLIHLKLSSTTAEKESFYPIC